MISASLEPFSLLLPAPIEMLYATDIPRNKQSEYITLSLWLYFITRPSRISLFANINVFNHETFSSNTALLKLLKKCIVNYRSSTYLQPKL